MNDSQIQTHIEQLVGEEHALYERHGSGGLSQDEQQRLEAINVQLDRYWDLLRQRRARRTAGQDPSAARLRSADVVEHYEE